ncbi:MAG: hypothetical protein AAB116_07850 [Candidatus Poribacteria bacterium]
MTDKISKSIKPFQVLLSNTFKQTNQKAIEVLMMLACGHIFEIYTPNQLIQTLYLDKNEVYGTIKSWSVFLFRKMFFIIGCHQALTAVRENISKSPATLSRQKITISVDDTVIDRLGKVISLTYNWYSGRHKKSVKGQNIIVITINVGDRIIPIWRQHHRVEQFFS